MAAEWPETSLGDLIEIDHGFAFQGEFFRDEPPGDILLTPGNFSIGGGFKAEKLKYYSGPVPEDFVLSEGDLLVTMTDLSKTTDTLGYPALVPRPEPGRRFLHNQRLGKVIIKPGAPLDKGFLYYLLCSREYRDEVAASATGTTVKHTSPSRIEQFRFARPLVEEQRAIANMLGTLDDKIELNRRMNETLEAIARALFKSWFVDFDPVRAKAEGRSPDLPKHFADLFPDSFQDPEVGVIPAGWRIESLGNVIELAYGRALKGTVRRCGRVPVYGSNGQVGWHDEKLVDGPGIIVGRKGNPGIVTWVPTDFFPIDTTFYVVPKGEYWSVYFLFHALRAQNLASLSADSAVPGLNRSLAYMSKQVMPNSALLEAFDRLIGPLYKRIHHNEEESDNLAALRDTLLPKLISGELRVKDADRFRRVGAGPATEYQVVRR